MQAEQLGRRFTDNNVILVVGGSGSGKSSLVKAGLLPNLKTIAPAPGRLGKWYVADCRPRTDPVAEVSESLWRDICEPLLADTEGQKAAALGFGVAADSAASTLQIGEACKDKFRALVTRPGTNGRGQVLDPYGVHEFANAVLDRIDDYMLEGLRAGPPNLLLLIDQFEEIFDDNRIDRGARDSIFALIDLARRNRGRGLFIVLTMRSEALHRCAEDPRLVDVVNQSSFLLELIDDRDVTDAIVGPARVALQAWGIMPTEARPAGDTRPFTPTLVDALAGELMRLRSNLVHKPDSLPLLQQTLEAIWDRTLERLEAALRETRDLTDFRIAEEDFYAVAGQQWGSQGPFRQCLNLRADACLADAMKILTVRSAVSSATAERILAAVFTTLARRDDRGNWVREFATAADMLATSGAAQAHRLTEADIVEALRPFVSTAFLQAERKPNMDPSARGDSRIAANSNEGAEIEYNVGHEALIRSWARCEQWLQKAEGLSELLASLDNSLANRAVEDEATATTSGRPEAFRLWNRFVSLPARRWLSAKSNAAWRWITAKDEEDAARLLNPQQVRQLQDLIGNEPLYAKQWTLDRLIEHRRELIRLRQQGSSEGNLAVPGTDGGDEAIANERFAEIIQVVDDANRWRTGSWTRVPGRARLQAILVIAVVVIGVVIASVYQSMRQQRLVASTNFELAVSSAQELLNQLGDEVNHGDTTVQGAKAMLKVASNIVDHVQKVETPKTIQLLAKLLWTGADINSDLGDLVQAYKSAKSARELVEPRSVADPGNPELLALLYNGIWRMGDAIADRDSLPATQRQALALYQEAEQVAQRLLQMAPDDGERQRKRAFVLLKIGDVHQQLDEWPTAIQTYREAVAIMQKVAANAPGSGDWQREFANTRSRLGQALAGKRNFDVSHGDDTAAKDDFDGAMTEDRAALEIRSRLLNQDHTDNVLQSNLARSHSDLAKLYAARGDVGVGDLDMALAEYRTAMGAFEDLLSRDPSNANWQVSLAPLYAGASGVQQRKGDLTAAVDYSRKAYAIRRDLARRDPTNQARQHTFATSATTLAALLVSRKQDGDTDEAAGLYRAAIATLDDLRPRYDLEVFRDYIAIGDIFKSGGQAAEALSEYELAAGIARDSATHDPASGSWQRSVAQSYRTIADVLVGQGRKQNAIEHYQDGVQFVEQLAATSPNNAQWSALAQTFKTEIEKLQR
jgi:tetratricopeptide (TPR) repeat protein